MYRLEKPLRVVEKKEGLYLIAVPKKNLKFETNQNVADMFEFLCEKNKFGDDVLDEFFSEYNIANSDDYLAIYSDLKKMGVVTQI